MQYSAFLCNFGPEMGSCNGEKSCHQTSI